MQTHELSLARNMLGMQKSKFAKKLGHSYRTFLSFEGGVEIPTETAEKIRSLLERKGLRFPGTMDFSDGPYKLSLRAPDTILRAR